MVDVVIAGAGPAGSIAALALARAGARVLIVDRESFPRDKLCGDTLNPGAVRLLRALGLTGGPLAAALPLAGMRLTGPDGSVVTARYAAGVRGLSVRRRELDVWLLERAIAAGAKFEDGLMVRGPLVDERAGLVRGLVMGRRGGDRIGTIRMPAIMTLAADGRRSVVAAGAGLRREPAVRRWAFGTYARGVADPTDLGEMHIRPRWYLGIAPVSTEEVNVCLVTPPRPDGRTPIEVIRRALEREPELASRFARAEINPHVRVLGPLASRVSAPGVPGLLLAGDAAGFIDPMTGDGLHLAMESALLAAAEISRVLVDGQFHTAPWRLAAARRARLGRKIRFNRWVCRLVESPAALRLASRGSRLFPDVIRRAVTYAGDVA
jgi:flavin-dependent dehydrogenase